MLKDSLTESETTNNSEKIYSPTNVEGLISKILDRQIIVDYFILTKGKQHCENPFEVMDGRTSVGD